MTSPSEPPQPSPEDPPDSQMGSENVDRQPPPVESEFEQALLEVERSLAALKERYTQVQQDRHRQIELQRQGEELKQQLRTSRRSPRSRKTQIQEQLQQIKQELETIELNLESTLFTWGSLKEPFWQAVRFGGLGIVVGWILKSCAG